MNGQGIEEENEIFTPIRENNNVANNRVQPSGRKYPNDVTSCDEEEVSYNNMDKIGMDLDKLAYRIWRMELKEWEKKLTEGRDTISARHNSGRH